MSNPEDILKAQTIQLAEMREELAAANRKFGALHVLIRCARAEAESANVLGAVRTLGMADGLITRGDISGCCCDGIKFGGV
jgi:hypothetical protein